MSRKKLSTQELISFLSTNREEWKVAILDKIDSIKALHLELSIDDIITIITPEFYDDVNDPNLSIEEVLDNNFLDDSLSTYSKELFLCIHDVYNR